MQQERVGLTAPEPAVGADQLLERGHLVPFVPVGAVEDDVGAVGKAVGATHVAGGVGAEGRQRIGAFHALLLDEVRAPGPSTTAPCCSEPAAPARIRLRGARAGPPAGPDTAPAGAPC